VARLTFQKHECISPRKTQRCFRWCYGFARAGVDILAGCDVSEPIPILGGLAHGASLHHELQLLVAAGLKPIEALRSATSIPAKRFGLKDRGRIASGLRANLLLVEGTQRPIFGHVVHSWCMGAVELHSPRTEIQI